MPHRYTLRSLGPSFFAIATVLSLGGGGALLGCGPSITDDMIPGVGPMGPMDIFPDFPAEPTSDGTVPSSVLPGLADAFSRATVSMTAGPCLSEPTIDAMYPLNFSPPLFEWSAPSDQNVFELRLHVDNQTNDLVLYTSKSSFVLPAQMWAGLAQHSAGRDVRITLRSGNLVGSNLMGDVYAGTTGVVHIAPVSAPGSIVYWTTSGGSALKGFRVGDTRSMNVLSPTAMRTAAAGDDTQCIGCHTSSPDGLLAFMGRSSSPNQFPFEIDARLVDGSAKKPSNTVVSDNAMGLLNNRYLQFMPTFSPAHYSATDSVVINIGGPVGANGTFELVWTDLHATSGGTGFMTRTGDPNWADSPSFSKDGTLVAYSSSNSVAVYQQPSINDIYVVPFTNGFGGNAMPLLGASDPNWNEYYPAYSPNDTLLAFSRVPVSTVIYDAPQAEVFIVPGRGGQATRLRANDPPTCVNKPSPGITNSYPRWAPQAIADGTKRYYWLVFSSKRRADPLSGSILPQLYLSVVVTSINAGVETVEQSYPAIYIPAQNPSENNHTPAWDVFQIPGAG